MSQIQKPHMLLGYNPQYDFKVAYGHEAKHRNVRGTFPAKFSLRDTGDVPPVRNQFTDNCWMYAFIASLETFMLRQKLVTPNTDYDTLSILHMTYDIFDIDPSKPENKNMQGMVPGIDTATKKQSYSGDRADACTYLTRGSGMVCEAVDPTFDNLNDNVPPRRRVVTLGKEQGFLVSGIRYIENPVGQLPDTDFIDDVKDALMSYGGVGIGICHENIYEKTDNTVMPHITSYYCNSSTAGVNHAVCIVGWDDTYAKGRFSVAPPCDGAFLVRNSWGIQMDSSGAVIDDGYFWMSYADMSIDNPTCVTAVRADYYQQATRCYRHNTFGMSGGSTKHLGDDKQIKFATRFDSAQTGEQLTHVGMYCLTPCLATVTCTIGGITTTVVSDYKLSYAGYHTIALPTALPLPSGEWTVTVTYDAIHCIRVFAPVEYRYKRYNNITITPGHSFVDNEDVVDLNKRLTVKNGNVVLHAFVRNTCATATKLEALYKSIESKLPASKDGRIDGLPTTVEGIDVCWHLEPQDISHYMPSYKNNITEYTVAGKLGLVNLTTNAVRGYLCATMGTAPLVMHKKVPVLLGVKGDYSFTAPKAAEGECTTTVSGDFPVNGAKVTVIARNNTKTTIVKNNKWEIKDFALFKVDIKKQEGWKDDYKETEIKVSITGDNSVALAKGNAKVNADCPYEKTSDGYIVKTLLGLVCALLVAGGTYAVIKIKRDIQVAEDEMRLLNNGAFLLGDLSSQGNDKNGKVTIRGIKNGCFMDTLYGAENIDFELESDSTCDSVAGCIARKIKKGGRIVNCAVRGEMKSATKIGGLFYEGEDVQVINCSVNLKVENLSDSLAGVAVKLSGGSVSSVAVTIDANGSKVCGIAESMEGGTVSLCAVNMQAQGKKMVAGIVGEAKDVKVQSCCVNGSFAASEADGIAGGIAAKLSGNTEVSNCRVSAMIIGGLLAGGIAATMNDTAAVKHCYAACKLNAETANGIAQGIAGKPAAVQQCVSVCSHIGGSHPARVATNVGNGCIAYSGITCDNGMTFSDSGTICKPPGDFTEQSLYTGLGWDFAITWKMHVTDAFPSLILNKGEQVYDYPFPRPYAPVSGFTFGKEQLICFYGNSHLRASAPTWSLAPADGSSQLHSGECLCRDGAFYLEIGTMARAGDYNLSVISPLDEHRYAMPILIKIT